MTNNLHTGNITLLETPGNANGCHRVSDNDTLKMQLFHGMRYSRDPSIKRAVDILNDAKEEQTNKVFAIQNLRLVRSAAAEDALIRIVSSKSTGLTFEALNTLSLTGTGKSFEALSRVSSLPFPSMERQKDFAMLLIGYREQLPGTENILERLQRGAHRAQRLGEFQVKFQAIRGDEIAEVLKHSTASDYGLTLSRNVAFSAKAGDQTFYFCFSDKLDNPAEWQQALRTKQVAGQLLMRDQMANYVTRQYIALATPKGDHTELSIFRKDGKLFMLARVNQNREGTAFTVSNIEEERVRAEKNDFTVDRRITVTMNLGFIRHHSKRPTTAIENDFQPERDERR